MRRLAAIDAQNWWMSANFPNDQFLLYGFDGVPDDLGAAVAEIRARARRCPDLAVRVRDDCRLTYPAWVPCVVGDDQFVMYDDALGWNECLDVVAQLADHQLDVTFAAWRLHVFTCVREVPGASGATGTVAVLQVSHALADGTRASALAAWLLGRPDQVAPVPPQRFEAARLPWRAVQAVRTQRELVRDTESGAVPAQAPSRPVLHSNAEPAGERWVRTIIRHRSQIPGPTVTVGVLAAISSALADHLREYGDDTAALGAEVPMAKPGVRRANNHFGNVGIGLYPELAGSDRIARISSDFADRRRRAAHPAMAASSRAFDATPAPLLRWGVAQFDPTVRAPMVTGNTVVSSVNRGAADLRFGTVPVVVTAGYPSLSLMMGLTHGVHGIGETVAVSVHAAHSAVADIDMYVARLDAALGG
ncbi:MULTISPECIES: DUF1298 domain-containing protein [unclassified Mycolicibacterium]|uniref:DUF1298 domain-containing protein n=1 Tax=unclassified Mycolicibacterium TaxID=2636767 RepID=UPI0013057BFA|nr:MULTISPECIES: DUF1298 domain-containing protein [unclassified Mycolicibacterium]MUL85092.1 DUF1298 domain-containing protein [Mycolicibacterium sp. CBMA 329]MUL91059.1 DUF1298 domain-containing protein [Mycolicibacterium sp. CBMA 331]MUL98270.1 DUF1298 domain-containing protein [Mycolicibacterium sp. CBMA 334]MUM40818.1 DUF1298 domain-containing protein [Mycolicibacterium sp. CBMA 247]MUM47014.1 DUF1298 domain-containing protein [Mycolicibacterium sp. CBMA 294]